MRNAMRIAESVSHQIFERKLRQRGHLFWHVCFSVLVAIKNKYAIEILSLSMDL